MNASVKGIIFGLVSYSLIAVMNMASKLLGEILSPFEVAFLRNALALAGLFIMIIFLKRWHYMMTKAPVDQFFRAFLGTGAFMSAIWALQYLPISVFTALSFAAPLVVLLLSWPVLKEPVGPWRAGAALLGFVGVIIVIDPFAAFSQSAIPLKGLWISFLFILLNAAVSLLLRKLGRTDPAPVTVFYFLALGSVFALLPASTPVLNDFPLLSQKIPDFNSMIISMIILLGVTGLISLLLKTQAFVLADAALVSPTAYCIIIWAVLFDWLIWESLPGLNVYLGAAIIIAANAIVIWRERKHKLPFNDVA